MPIKKTKVDNSVRCMLAKSNGSRGDHGSKQVSENVTSSDPETKRKNTRETISKDNKIPTKDISRGGFSVSKY